MPNYEDPYVVKKGISWGCPDSHKDGWGRVAFASQLWHSQKVLCLIWFRKDRIFFCTNLFCK